MKPYITIVKAEPLASNPAAYNSVDFKEIFIAKDENEAKRLSVESAMKEIESDSKMSGFEITEVSTRVFTAEDKKKAINYLSERIEEIENDTLIPPERKAQGIEWIRQKMDFINQKKKG